MVSDSDLQRVAGELFRKSFEHRYSYNFTWMGRPIIQYPQDIVAMQELIWSVQPDLIIETGIAHGGSLVFYASMLELLGNDGLVLGIDIDIRAHNRRAIEAHPMSARIRMIEGSSIAPEIADQVASIAQGRKRVLVALDSNHTHDHVLRELELYSPMVSVGSYLVVFDTVVEDMPKSCFPDRPWGPGNNPKTAVHEFLRGNDRFEIDRQVEGKLLLTVSPDGYLRCVKP
jgi:cephalosporin hydroxylase